MRIRACFSAMMRLREGAGAARPLLHGSYRLLFVPLATSYAEDRRCLAFIFATTRRAPFRLSSRHHA